MGQQPLTDGQCQQAIDAYALYGDARAAGQSLNLPENTFRNRIKEGRRRELKISAGILDPTNVRHLLAQVKELKADLKKAEATTLDHSVIKAEIIKLASSVSNISTPAWALTSKRGHDFPGVPSLMLSDLHWGEVVDLKQVNGVNEYNLRIARERLKEVGQSAIRLLTILSPKLDYPGMVLILGGDLINGNLREEMTATNEENVMPVLVDLFEHISALILTMAETFGKVFLPCVTGNHGRATHKMWAADRHATSYEWLIYCLLAKHFANDKRITFFIPDGTDAHYRVFNHRFVLTHGDAFRGGDGVIGPLGPIIRGDFKKRARNAQLNMDYDTMLLGHFHSYMHLTKLIVNGSLVGYNEYAYANNFPYEAPCQALFLVHPKYGITYRMPVYAAKREIKASLEWVSIAK